MDEFSGTLVDVESRFGSEQACWDYLVKLRWPEGFMCPRCGGRTAWTTTRRLFVCATCQHQASVTAGTIFQDRRKPLMLWFRAMWWITAQKHGASALELQRVLGLGSYVTAWTWLHKLRRAMVRPGRDRLQGRVEVDELFVGGIEEGVRGRQTETKALVAVACEERGQGHWAHSPAAHPATPPADALKPFIAEAVEPGSLVHTDGWEGYAGLTTKGYRHRVTVAETTPYWRRALSARAPGRVACSSGGCLAPIRAPSVSSIWTTTSTSSRSGSTAARHALAASSSSVSWNRPSPSSRSPTGH